MVHRGNLLKKAVENSGFSIIRFAKKLGYERSYIYRLFTKSNLDLDIIVKAGKILDHDFSSEIPELNQNIYLKKELQLVKENPAKEWLHEKLLLLEKIQELQHEIISLHKENKELLKSMHKK